MTTYPWFTLILMTGVFILLKKLFSKSQPPPLVTNAFKGLGNEYKIFNDICLKGERGMNEIDTVITSPYGVFVVSQIEVAGKIEGNVNDREWTLKSGETIYNPLWRIRSHTNALEAYLGPFPYGSFVLTGNANIQGDAKWKVISNREFIKKIREHSEVKLNDKQLEYIESSLKERQGKGRENFV